MTGIPTADEFGGDTDFTTHTGGGLEELARAKTLGSTGWIDGTTYNFSFDFGPNNLEVYVNGLLELSIKEASGGNFNHPILEVR